VFYLFCNSIYFLSITDQVYVRRPSFLKKFHISSAREFFLRGDISWAKNALEKTLRYDNQSVAALINLAECYRLEGDRSEAEAFQKRAEEISSPAQVDRFLFDRGYLKEWFVIGDFRIGDEDYDGIEPSEIMDLLAPRIKAEDSETQRFQKLFSSTAFIDLKEVLDNPPKTFVYALSQVYSPLKQKVHFRVGVDDGLTFWLNQKKIYEDNQKFWWIPDEMTIPASLDEGWNLLLLRVFYAGGEYYGFSVRMIDNEGKIMDQVKSKAFDPEFSARKK
jgi:tetratricopeptide (TPR) repeat protein